MRLLILTQAVDQDDPVLGFFHGWLQAFAQQFEHVTVITLKRGRFSLPQNVQVHSLGKEDGVSRLVYLWRFYRYIWSYRREYDAVFVHMNPEYVLLGWKSWWLLKKRIYLWHNHHAGGTILRLAVLFCTRVFCTSRFAYVAKYQKTTIMPVGIDTNRFMPRGERRARSILSLGRIAPSKRIHVMLKAFTTLHEHRIDFSASLYGDALPEHSRYLKDQKQFVQTHGLAEQVHFYPGVRHDDTSAIFARHDLFVNASSSGMFDKTILEALASGALALSSNENLRGAIDDRLLFAEGDATALSDAIERLLALAAEDRASLAAAGRQYVEREHSLAILAMRLARAMH